MSELEQIEEKSEEVEGEFVSEIPEAEDPEEEETPKETGRAKAILEGLLFIVGDDGLTAEQASEVLEISKERVEVVFDELMQDYLSEDRGIEIANYGGTYRFLSKAVVHEYAKKLFQINKQATLSQAALETLAIIAYKQPITRQEIEAIRGVKCDHAVNKLIEYDLIMELGRLDAPGRPILFGTTEEFLRRFGVQSVEDLPLINPEKMEDFRAEVEDEIQLKLNL